jgi:acetyl-CoA carboxylase carboxyl transferase subunit beta
MKEILKRHPRYHSEPENFQDLPDNLWVRCPRCRELLYAREHEQALSVCRKCKYHFGIGARHRIEITLDADSFEERDAGLRSTDPLDFRAGDETYQAKLERFAEHADPPESFVYGTGRIDGQPVVFGAVEFSVVAGTMGAVFGEKVVRAMELAFDRELPLVIVSCGGGARMQEGAVSLLQMARTVAALERFKTVGRPFISIMVDPCLGGITASYAMLGDVNVAEPGAYIGFAGRRVIEQTMRQKLPQDAATAEFLLKHGMIDIIAPRPDLPGILARLLRLCVTANPAKTRRTVEQYA